MPIRASESRQRGSVYVEAAFSLPIFLGVLYVTIFFCVLTHRQMAVQFAASRASDDVRSCLQGRGANGQKCDLCQLQNTLRSRSEATFRGIIGTTENLNLLLCKEVCGGTKGSWVSSCDEIGAGDIYHVVLTVPTPKLFGGTVPFFGISENHVLEGSALGVLERGAG